TSCSSSAPGPRPGRPASSASRARTTRSRTATSSRSASTSDAPSLLRVSWLLRDGTVLASLEVADTRRARRQGLLGRDGIEGALLIVPARAVHTFGMRFPIDVAWCDRDLTVLRTATLRPNRLSRVCLGAHCV